MSEKNKTPNFNYNTPLGEVIKYCQSNNKIFEINEKGFLFFDLIPNIEKEEDIKKLRSSSNIYQVHVKNQGKKRFSDFGIPKRRIPKKEINRNKTIVSLTNIIKIIETGFVSNSWGEKFPYKKLENNTIIVFEHDNNTIKYIVDSSGMKLNKGIPQENKLNTLPMYQKKNKRKTKTKKGIKINKMNVIEI